MRSVALVVVVVAACAAPIVPVDTGPSTAAECTKDAECRAQAVAFDVCEPHVAGCDDGRGNGACVAGTNGKLVCVEIHDSIRGDPDCIDLGDAFAEEESSGGRPAVFCADLRIGCVNEVCDPTRFGD